MTCISCSQICFSKRSFSIY